MNSMKIMAVFHPKLVEKSLFVASVVGAPFPFCSFVKVNVIKANMFSLLYATTAR